MLYPIKIEFKDYPSGSWQDWSEYLSEPPNISKKVESEIEGEAGLIVFDDAEVSFRYEVGSPVYNSFSIDLTSKQRYLFRISAPKSDKTFVQLFEGIADFSTLKWNEFSNVISFNILDKLTALNILQDTLIRTKNTLNARVLAQYPSAAYLRFAFTPIGSPVPKECSEIWIRAIDSIGNVLEFNSPIIFPGELIRDPHTMNADSSPAYYLVTESWIETNPDGQKWNKIKIVPSLTAYHDGVTIDMSLGYCEYLEKEVYGIDILNYIAGVPQSIDGLKFLEVFIKSSWPDITVTFRGISTFNIALSYSGMLVDEKPFGKDPLDLLKMLADSMKVYVFTDKTGNIIVQSKSSLATGGATRSIGNTKIVSGPEKKYFWDKLVDGVTINAKSWVLDQITGENLIGIAELTKQPAGFSALQKIKPKNSIKRDVLVGDPTIDTQEELNTYAAQEALSILNFYGLRHSGFDTNLNLDDNTINWELIDNLTINSLVTFFTKMEIDLVARNIFLEAVEIFGHDYDFRQLVLGPAQSSSIGFIGGSGSGGNYYSGITPIFNLPLQMSGGIVSLLSTDNLKITSNQLDTIQPIKTTDTPTFNQMLLSAAATLSNHAVRADRTLQITTNAPLTGGGIAVDLTSDRSWSLGINSANLLGTTNQVNVVNGTGAILGLNNVTLSLPQNIHTGATPTFNQLTLSSAGSGSSNAVRADRSISTSYPLTGGGNLTADRSLAFSYNATNLKLTSNALNTIQDIATTSSPTFANVKLTGLGDGYIPYHQTDATGFANSNILYSGGLLGIGSPASFTDLLNINGSIRQFGNSKVYNNFTSGWTGAGWQLDYGVSLASKSYLEIDNLTVRGSMKVYELVINQIRATNGSLFVSSTAKVASVGSGTVGDYSLTFEDPEGHGYMPFADNDIIMMQRVDLNGTSIVRYLVGKVLSHSSNTIEFLIQDGTDTPQKGDVFVRIGSTSDANRQGTVYLTSDDTASPYIDIYDGVSNYSLFKTSSVRKVRLGKLTGLTDSDFGSLSGYGLYTTNAYLKGGIWATFGKIAGWTIDTQKLYNGTDIILDAANKKVSVNNDAVKMYYTSAGDYGIKDSAGKFQLGSTNQIAGWVFDMSKLSNSNTRLEASASLKGLAVSGTILSNNVDLLKIGQFTFSTPTDYTSNLTFSYTSSGGFGSWTQGSSSLFPTFSTSFWSGGADTLMKSFSWYIADASAYYNKYVRVRATLTIPAADNGSNILPTCILKLKNAGTIIESQTLYSSFVSGQTVIIDQTFLCLEANIYLTVELFSTVNAYTYKAITSLTVNNFYVVDSTPITEIANADFRIYDSGGRRYLRYNSDGLKVTGGINIDGLTLRAVDGRLDSFSGSDNRLGLKGYTIPLLAGGGAPSSASTYYWANQVSAPATSAYIRIYIPKKGKIRAIVINTYSLSSPTISSGYWSMSIMINGGSPVEFASLSSLSGTQQNIWANYDLFSYGIEVNAGDFIYIKEVTPTFGTAPSTTYRSGVIYIE